ncbi:MAG: pimeloyl-CoA dehydrogenase small subunit [Alphaproteobacteria bacterium]|nr:MAG: pimeloyl-CoA dehydrogenase small subunit [Alphaproteobacteria bacterium]
MDFTEPQDRAMFRDTLRRWFADNYPITRRQAAAEAPGGLDAAAWEELAGLGAVGVMFDEAAGGFSGDPFDIAVLFEELGRGGSVEPFLATLVAGRLVADAGHGGGLAQLGAAIEGRAVLSPALFEPAGRYDAADVQTTASREGGGWRLEGTKAVVPHGGAAGAFVVSARSAGGRWDEDGLSLFLVPADAPGVAVHGHPGIDGHAAAQVVLTGVSLGEEALIGPEGAAWPLIEAACAAACLALSAEALGLMEVCRDATVEYLRTRHQFGRPIGSFQALQHRMATLAVEIEQARSAVINAAGRLGAARRAREMAAAEAKALAGRIGRLVAEEAIQMHGGIGMTWEYPMTHFAKRLVMIDHWFGDVDHHTARFAELSRQAG